VPCRCTFRSRRVSRPRMSVAAGRRSRTTRPLRRRTARPSSR
jgi:hypothetical protein